MKIIIQYSKLILICLVFTPIDTCAISRDPSMDSIALDSSIRMGRLPNGFTYYLKSTENTDEISLRFYIKVGYYNERIGENQFAHLVEHIAGNENYQKAYFANDMNLTAYTGAATARSHTVYYNSISSKSFKTLKNRLQDFIKINNLDMKNSLIKQEARCLRQEFFYRAKGLALNRAFSKSVYKTAILFDKNGETPYSSWLTTYDMGGISISSVRDFYRRWYRPENMGLIITGNLHDKDSLEQQLIDLYGKIPKGKDEKDEFDVREFYLSALPLFKTIERKEVNRFTACNKLHSEISLLFRVKKFHKSLNSRDKWLNKQIYKAMYIMIDNRLRRYVNTVKPIHSEIEKHQLSLANYQVEIENKPGRERENIQRVTNVLQEIWRNGFKQEEWDKQKQVMLNQITAKDTSRMKYWEKQLENHFIYGEILPANKKGITRQWINSVSLDDVNSYLQENFSVMPEDIYITASKGHPALSFTEKQVRGWITDAIKQPIELEAATDITCSIPIGKKNTALMSQKEVDQLKKVEYQKIGIDADTGLEILQLSNGVKLLLDIKEINKNSAEMISITGSSPRGASFFPPDGYYSAISAPEIVKQSGAGGLSRKAIRNKLGGVFRPSEEPVQLHIKNNNSTVSARAKFEEFEKYLQLIYLYFSSPQQDTTAFSHWKNQIKDNYFGKIYGGVSPRNDMKNAVAKLLNFRNFAPSNQISTEQFYQKQNVELEKAMECYQTIFGNASDFTFIVKGKYEKERILPLLQKYLGNLLCYKSSSYSTMDTLIKIDNEIPKGPVYHTFYADKMETAYKLYTVPYMLSYIFPIPEENWKDRVVMEVITTYLRPKVNRELRFIKGGSFYDESIDGRYSKTKGLYSFTLYIDSLDDELEWIRSECKAMIEDIKDNGINKESKKIVLEDPLFFGRYSTTPQLQEKVMQFANSLSSIDIKKVAAKYFKESQQYEFVFRENDENIVFP